VEKPQSFDEKRTISCRIIRRGCFRSPGGTDQQAGARDRGPGWAALRALAVSGWPILEGRGSFAVVSASIACLTVQARAARPRTGARSRMSARAPVSLLPWWTREYHLIQWQF